MDTLIQEVGGGERLEGLEVLYRTKNIFTQLPVEQGIRDNLLCKNLFVDKMVRLTQQFRKPTNKKQMKIIPFAIQ